MSYTQEYLEKCQKMLKDDSDFRFYYDVLEDSKKPTRKLKISKKLNS